MITKWTDAKIVWIAGAVVITLLSVYIAILRGSLRSAQERADENLRRAESCEDVLAIERRSRTAAIEAQGYANAQRKKIDETHANLVQEIGAIVDSGALDSRVCELARAAYHSAMCAAADSEPVRPAVGATP